MYKRPPKHVERAKLTILYTIMTFSVLVVVVLLVLVVGNYGYNRATGTFEQRGLVQLDSIPSGAAVEVDGTRISSRTSTKYSVEPGEHSFTFTRDGYEPWSLATSIKDGSLVWLNYARLVPTKRPVETLYGYPALAEALISPNSRLVLTLPDAQQPEFRLIDIAHDTPTGTILKLPKAAYEATADEAEDAPDVEPTYTVESWDESSRYAAVWRTLGKSRQLIILDTQNPSQSVNVTREFSLPISSVEFAGRSGNVLYAKIEDTIRKINISEGTVTRSLIDNVATFSLEDDDTIAYVSKPVHATGSRTVGVYRDGDSEPIVLRTVLNEDTPVSISLDTYYNTTYTVITEGSRLDLYRGHYDQGISGLVSIASRTLDSSISSAEFNGLGSHVLVRAGDEFASYDIDRNLISTAKLEKGSSKDLFWIDSYHLGLLHDGELSMRDIDGTNMHVLNTAHTGLAAGLSRNGTYMYSFGQPDGANSDTVSLQRIRMILR